MNAEILVGEQPHVAPLSAYAHLYNMADEYDIGGLSEFVTDKFKAIATIYFDTIEFLDAIQLVYSESPDHLRGLRDCIIEVVLDNADTLLGDKEATFRDEYKKTPDFGMELAAALVDQRSISKSHTQPKLAQYTCTMCGPLQLPSVQIQRH